MRLTEEIVIKTKTVVALAALTVFLTPTLAGNGDRTASATVISDDPEPVLGAIGHGTDDRVINDNADPFAAASEDPEPVGMIIDDPDPFGSRVISDGPDPISEVIADDPDPFSCIVNALESTGASVEDDSGVVRGIVSCMSRTAIIVWVAR